LSIKSSSAAVRDCKTERVDEPEDRVREEVEATDCCCDEDEDEDEDDGVVGESVLATVVM
jgi:hypothetical protein